MTPIEPLAALALSGTARVATASMPSLAVARSAGFADLLAAGLREVDNRVSQADKLVQSFAVGETIPLHQITIALEQARLSVDLAMEVRARLVEAYRDFMNMQV